MTAEPPAYDWTILHGDDVATIEPPSPEEMAADRERIDREAWERAEATETPRLRALEDVPDPRERADYEPDEMTAERARALAYGWRTLADFSDEPPGPLLFGMAEPETETLMYASAGTGKGATAVYLMQQAQAAGMRVALFDAERRPREYARRASGLGIDRAAVIYIDPSDLGTAAGRPIWEGIDALAGIVRDTGSDLLLIDSVLPATGLGEERIRSDPQVPYLYFGALGTLSIPTVSFGHPPKGSPEGEPFGSMGWVAACRLTWLGTRGQGEGHVVRWRPRKRNERGKLAGIRLTFTYGDDGRPVDVLREDDDQSTVDWLIVAMRDGRPRSVSELAEEYLEDEDEAASKMDTERAQATLRKQLQRHKGELFAKSGTTGPSVRWSLRLES